MPSEQKIHNFLILAFQYFSFQYFEEAIVSISRKSKYIFISFGGINININTDKEYFTYS